MIHSLRESCVISCSGLQTPAALEFPLVSWVSSQAQGIDASSGSDPRQVFSLWLSVRCLLSSAIILSDVLWFLQRWWVFSFSNHVGHRMLGWKPAISEKQRKYLANFFPQPMSIVTWNPSDYMSHPSTSCAAICLPDFLLLSVFLPYVHSLSIWLLALFLTYGWLHLIFLTVNRTLVD